MRLIDADALIVASQQDGAYGYVSAKEIADAPTIAPCAGQRWTRRIEMKKSFETINRDRLRSKIAKEHICCDICGRPLDPLGPFEYWRTHAKREVYVHWDCIKEVLLK